MTGHFEQGAWVESTGLIIQYPDNTPFNIQVNRVAELLGICSSPGPIDGICVEGLDGRWYSLFDILEGIFKRVK